MSTSRSLLIVLTTIAGLFAYSLSLGMRNQTDGQPDTNQQTWVQRFGENLVPNVDLTSITGSCWNVATKVFLVPSSSTPCKVTIPPAAHAWRAVRRIQLRLLQGESIGVVYDGLSDESSNLPDPNSTPDPKTKSFVILKQGGTLTLTCPSGTPCTVEAL